MIYISTTCANHQKIRDSVIEIAECGFNRIELSGGTDNYPELLNDLIKLKDRFNLRFRLHNYFPPPREHFVLNLASLNQEIYQKTINHYLRAIEMSQYLGCNEFGIHAGFYIDIMKECLGGEIPNEKIVSKAKSMEKFCIGYDYLKERTGSIKLYIENNSITNHNYRKSNNSNPFLLTNYHEYKELRELIEFKLLLDVGHLFVSSNTLRLNFKEELKNMANVSDYIHISDNNGLSDQNRALDPKGIIFSNLKKIGLTSKTITIEIYGNMNDVSKSINLLRKEKLI